MIRDARPDDRDEIVALTDAAFGGEEKALRIVREAEPTVELVWDEDGRIVGHVLLSRMRMGEHRPLQLSPLSVAPERQGRGIGGALTREALARADALGEPFVLLLWTPDVLPPLRLRARGAARDPRPGRVRRRLDAREALRLGPVCPGHGRVPSRVRVMTPSAPRRTLEAWQRPSVCSPGSD